MRGHLQDENTWLLDFTEHSPLAWAIPLYGYLMPFLVAVTTVTNTFIIIVLSQKHLRTPTNAVLLSMAVTDLLTVSGVSAFWCHANRYMFEMLPSAFHTAAIWLAVFLAVQRYVYVCIPNHVYLFCTPKTTKFTIIGIIMASFVTLLPEVTARKRFAHHNTFTDGVECYEYSTAWVNWVGKDIVFSGFLWVRVVLHAVPCILLLIFTCKLGSTLKQAEIRKKSWAAVDSSRKPSCRGSMSSGRSLYATTRMLAMICSVFLLLEIPAAILNGVQFAVAVEWWTPPIETIRRLNKGLVIRNILIVLVSPIQFGIYCSMSEQFRLTVRQLFTSRLLFVAQAQATFHGGKRYSLVLVDLDGDESKQGTTGMRCFGFLDKDKEKGLRKVSHQMSSFRMIVLWRVAAGVLLPLVPTLAVFGNFLVILAVFQDRVLQTVTNMLIVSLAVSDLMVALFVMSFGVYYEWNGFKWQIGHFLCHLYLACDVICSTASILNLLAISLDRYMAISHPISYAQVGTSNRRAVTSLCIVWGVSIIVGTPLLFGVNPMENEQCELGNPYFNAISSVFSFFLPCATMICLYTVVFKRLRARERARSQRHATNKKENDKISSALLGGASFARQMGKHFKNRADQIVLENSFQTSSFPTVSESSDDISSLTPMPTDLNFGPTTLLEQRKKIAESESLPVMTIMNGNLKSKLITNCTDVVQDEDVKATPASDDLLTRSFGDDLEELFPFIDCGANSSKSSKEDLAEEKIEVKVLSNSVPIIHHTERRISQSLRLSEPRRAQQKQIFSEGFRNGSIKRKVTDVFSLPPRSSLLHVQTMDDMAKVHKTTMPTKTKSFVDFLNADDCTFTDSMRICKDQLWNRVTGWKTRPNRQMMKKASKQMRREHKATVTLAVVLAVFLVCWLPFFTLHLFNSVCAIVRDNPQGCLPMLPMFLSTWLGYLNSSLNPLIYTIFDQRFRRAFRNVLSCGMSKK